MTPWQQHVEKWSTCTDCDACRNRNKVVLFRGSIPNSILFVGEAPGPSENSIGKVFCGPAGKLLDELIEKAFEGRQNVKYGLTNLVACLPQGDERRKFGEPTDDSIKACQPRLVECIELCQPKVIIAVGKLAEKWLPKITKVKIVPIIHPAAILRCDLSQRGLAELRTVTTLRDVVENLK
jgi:uracil-DNA glycosylase family 4